MGHIFAQALYHWQVMRRLTSDGDLALYDAWLRARPEGTLWQSLEWKKYQEALGRETRIYASFEQERISASALVIIDRTSFRLATWDIPRGPIGEDNGALLKAIFEDARRERCLSLYLSPPSGQETKGSGQKSSPRHEQPEATRMIDLTQSEEEILKQMKPKGRYNISVAEKHGVLVAASTDVTAFHRLLAQTGQRDRFGILPLPHYEAFLRALPGSFLLFASLPPNPEPIAGLLGVIWGKTGFYYYGASSYALRALMAPYALQWTAMRHCKAAGCASYDLLGIAPPNAPANHPWQGVSAFKEKFGGTVVTYPPEQQIVLRPMTSTLLSIKRRLLG